MHKNDRGRFYGHDVPYTSKYDGICVCTPCTGLPPVARMQFSFAALAGNVFIIAYTVTEDKDTDETSG
jgi:hypothetical protein